jgi:putative transcription factor
MSYADWTPVVLDKRGRRAPGESKDAALSRAMKSGSAVAEKRFDGGSNKTGATAGAGMSARKLEEDTEHFVHATVDFSLSMAIQQARLAKKMTQKEVAMAICEKPTVIADYEAGRAIPNPTLLSKLDRVLGVHLPRPAKKK